MVKDTGFWVLRSQLNGTGLGPYPNGPSTPKLGTWDSGKVVIVQVWGKYLLIRYLDP